MSGFDTRLSPRAAAVQLNTIGTLAIEDVKKRLKTRGVQQRSGADDQIFAQFNTSLAIGLNSSFESYYMGLFHDVDEVTREFERTHQTEVHKGSIYFNMAVLCLHANDFDRSLYYFHAADLENQATHQQPSTALFATNEIFKRNVTNRLQLLFNAVYKVDKQAIDLLVGEHPGNDAVEQVLLGLPPGQFGSFIVTSFRFVITEQLPDENDGLRTLYHRLLSDFCQCFEAGLKAHLSGVGGTLGKVLTQDLRQTRVGDISGEVGKLFKTMTGQVSWKCASVLDLNALISTQNAIGQIAAEKSQVSALAKLYALVLALRNQVTHDLDLQNALCRDRAKARRVLGWMLFAMLFRTYL